ncbi:hypothetical protein GALMADRAFT_57569 [Galerina marginata CBS 339.88]|uniref:DUF6699 domain-containing protein n=1 Tax=Galerina marginata (strain CBS 339.88) TaxID=685588 RepID=A0A067TIN4_GALM3|nr:hypothetical protein GALMADRAFT_57569 [Galerina marginata CBS 339.88]
MDHPSTITRHRFPISSSTLREPATNPPQRFMNVTSPFLPWTIKIHAQDRPYITVEDVLYAVYYSLRTNITAWEFNLLLSRNDRRRAAHAYEWRYRRHRSIKTYEEEKHGGMKHVDYLMGHTYFLDISNISRSSQPCAWQLNVAW